MFFWTLSFVVLWHCWCLCLADLGFEQLIVSAVLKEVLLIAFISLNEVNDRAYYYYYLRKWICRLVLSFDHCDCNDSWQLSMIVYAWCGKSDPDAWDVDRVIIQFFCLVFMILLSCFLFPNSTSFTQAMRWKCSGSMLWLRVGSLSEVKLEFFGFSILEFDNSTFIVDHGA